MNININNLKGINRMRCFLLCGLFVCCISNAMAQGEPLNYTSQIDMGSFSNNFSFSNHYFYRASGNTYFTATLSITKKMDVKILIYCGNTLTVKLFKGGTVIATTAQQSGEITLTANDLASGSYRMEANNLNYNDYISLSVEGKEKDTTPPLLNPNWVKDLGTWNNDVFYEDVADFSNTEDYYDIYSIYYLYYKFVTTQQTDIAIAVDETSSYSYIELLNKYGVPVSKALDILPDTFFVRVVSDNRDEIAKISIRSRIPQEGNLGSYPGYNYVRKITPLTANETRYLNLNQSLQTIVYYDGLGRQEQTVQKGITPSKADLVMQQEYDNFGRNSKTWLPTPVGNNNGVYVNNITTKAVTYRNDTYPYSEPVYEKSPLNRVLEQYGPGANWRSNGGHSAKTEYLTNNTNYPCLRYSLAGDNLVNNGNYADSSLYVTKTTDEDGKIAFEMKDKSGRLILQRQMNGTTQHDTYYVYDDLGNLRYVLPPAASDATTGTATYSETTTRIEYFAYIYKYDYRNRCIEKKLPGADPVYYKYDTADRLIFSQDGEQRQTDKWTFTIPDILGRVVLQGECTNPTTAISANVIAVYSNTASGMFASLGYTISGVSFTLQKTHQVLYYDNYKFKSNWGSNYNYVTPAGFENKRYGTDTDMDKAKGLLSGSRIAYSGGSDLCSVFYYDKKGRMIQSVSDNHMHGYEKEYINYSFSGQPVWKQMQHNTFYYDVSVNITETYTYKYDHADRLTETYYKIDDESQKLFSKLTYDDLGRISNRSLHNNLISINYTYNIRNWLKSIASGQALNETLYYETTYSSNTPAYNGNLSALQWDQSKNRSTRGYQFHYDGLNRLTSAQYLNGYNITGEYDEEFEYNKMGSIMRLKRYINTTPGAANPTIVLFDDLRFGYRGNQTAGVCDIGEPSSPYGFAKGNVDYTYAYNKNGSLKTDKSRGIAGVQYNSLNLPEQIQFTYGHKTRYSYDALGNKRTANYQTVKNNMNVPIGTTNASISYSDILSELETQYCGHIIYEGGALKYIHTPEGFVMPTSHDFYGYYYSIKDHLGNVRAVVSDWDGLRQETNYYPSGLPYPNHHSKDGYNPEFQPYKFGGKELDEMNGLRSYDFHARQRKMDTPVFDTMDPLCEKYYSVSPYAYCLNNPLIYTDPTGMYPVYDPDGNLLGTDDNGLQGHAIFMNKDNFKQGMSYEDAMKHNLGIEGLSNQDAIDRYTASFEGLKDRPDWDRYLTLSEANDWYRNGNGQPLFVDLNKIDLSGIVSLGEKYVGQVKTFNLLFDSGSLNDGLVYGNITLKRYPNHTVRAFADTYDFDMKSWWNPLNWGRNIETKIGQKVAGQGTGYEINIYGSKKLTPILPWIK